VARQKIAQTSTRCVEGIQPVQSRQANDFGGFENRGAVGEHQNGHQVNTAEWIRGGALKDVAA
jgi:hypothetical protein